MTKLITVHVNPPVPTSAFDWCAYDADTYDGASDAGGQAVGWGRTELEAIEDWRIQFFDVDADQITFEFETYPSWRREELAHKHGADDYQRDAWALRDIP